MEIFIDITNTKINNGPIKKKQNRDTKSFMTKQTIQTVTSKLKLSGWLLYNNAATKQQQLNNKPNKSKNQTKQNKTVKKAEHTHFLFN